MQRIPLGARVLELDTPPLGQFLLSPRSSARPVGEPHPEVTRSSTWEPSRLARWILSVPQSTQYILPETGIGTTGTVASEIVTANSRKNATNHGTQSLFVDILQKWPIIDSNWEKGTVTSCRVGGVGCSQPDRLQASGAPHEPRRRVHPGAGGPAPGIPGTGISPGRAGRISSQLVSLTGDHERGEAVYRRECIKCHRLSSREHPIGPNLIRGSEKDPESLLVNILDPNRFVEPQYLQYVATDLKGGLYTGLLTDETATSVTLVEGDDLRNTLLRERTSVRSGRRPTPSCPRV